MTIHLAGGIAVHEDRLLLVASRYRNQPQPLWNLPGGRQRPPVLPRRGQIAMAIAFDEDFANQIEFFQAPTTLNDLG